MAGSKSHQHRQDSKHERGADRSRAPQLPPREGKRDQTRTTKPANIYGIHFDRRPEHGASKTTQPPSRDDHGRQYQSQTRVEPEDLIDDEMQRAVQLSKDEVIQRWLQDSTVAPQIGKNVVPQRRHVNATEMERVQNAIPRDLVAENRESEGPGLRAQLIASHGVEVLSEDEQLQLAMLMSSDDVIPAEPSRTSVRDEEEELHLAVLMSEGLEARRQLIADSLAQAQQQDESIAFDDRVAVHRQPDRAPNVKALPPVPVTAPELDGNGLYASETFATPLQISQPPTPRHSNAPGYPATPLPAPVPRPGRLPDWLKSRGSSLSSLANGARGAIDDSLSAAGSSLSVASDSKRPTKSLGKTSEHSRRESKVLSVPITSSSTPPSQPSLMSRQGPQSPEIRHQGPIDESIATLIPQSTPVVAVGPPVRSNPDAHVYSEQSIVGMAEPVLDAPGVTAQNSMQDLFSNGLQPIVFNGPVTINNNHIVINDGPESTGSLLKRAVHQRFSLGKTKARGAAIATTRAASSGNNFLKSHLGGLNFGLGWRGNESDRFSIDGDEDNELRPASPSPTNAAVLDQVNERLQAQSEAPFQSSRSGRIPGIAYDRGDAVVNRDGSPVPLINSQLHLVTQRSPSPPSPQKGRPIPPRTPSMALGVHGSAASEAELLAQDEGTFQDSAIGMSNVSLNPVPKPQGQTHRASEEYHCGQVVGQSTAHLISPVPIRRRPVSVASHGPDPKVEDRPQQFPVATPQADRSRVDTPDSLYAYPDSPTYMKATLARKHVHPPMNTEWANVPPAGQRLEHLNTRAMTDVDRFGHDARTTMPSHPEAAGTQTQTGPDGRLTPNTRAHKAEKDMQKKLRNAV